MPTPVLTVCPGIEQAINYVCKGVWRAVVDEGCDVRPFWRQARQIKSDSTNELLLCRWLGQLKSIRSQLRNHKTIDVAKLLAIRFRNDWTAFVSDRFEGPVTFVFCSIGDPATNQIDLPIG